MVFFKIVRAATKEMEPTRIVAHFGIKQNTSRSDNVWKEIEFPGAKYISGAEIFKVGFVIKQGTFEFLWTRFMFLRGSE